ncbi:MAG: hypothetical protein LAN64_04925 [Acidobacteriia bacterium]|nr:hypothetical protein [Terriglobia bacterium]
MFARSLVFAVVLSAVTLHAQSTPPQAPFPGGMPQPGAGAPTAQPMPAPQQERLRELQQNLIQMGTLLAKMRADVAKIKDADSKRIAEENVALWERLLMHVQRAMEPAMRNMPPGPGSGARGMRRPMAQPTTTPPAATTPPKQP